MPAAAIALVRTPESAAPPNARNCMNSRWLRRCGCPSFMPPFSKTSGGSGPRRCACAAGGVVVSAISGKYNPRIPMHDYRVRAATAADVDALVHHRLAMFTEMGTAFDAPVIRQMFRDWLLKMMPAAEYLAWVCDTPAGDVVAGARLPLPKWPPGPSALASERIAYVYNVYTEPAHRKQGLARRLMDTVHTWCAGNGVAAVALNAAPAARHLYESQGYRPAPSPMMWKIT